LDQFATGHYAQTSTDEFGKTLLRKGVDERKDQSYVLSVLSQDQLSRTVFPSVGIPNQKSGNWQENLAFPLLRGKIHRTCVFLAGQDYREFFCRYAPNALTPGKIVDTAERSLASIMARIFHSWSAQGLVFTLLSRYRY
jgi:tRNA-specific 2-thiouridylase